MKCGSQKTKKDGFKNGRQRYRCRDCYAAFQNNKRNSSISKKLWGGWADRKQTYRELADDYSKNRYWVQKQLDQYEVIFPELLPQETCICMDATDFGGFLVLVFRSPELKRNLYAKVIHSETIDEYRAGIKYLIDRGWKIKAIVSDGKGLRQDFYGIPVQMCQFHQQKIITKHLTKNPILEANIELRNISMKLTKTDKESFDGWISDWYEKWGKFLKERTFNLETGKYHFTHRRTRSAFFSLKRNLDYLFTFYDYMELNIPNTNNSIEGYFSYLKRKVNVHNGLRKDRKIKLIFHLLFNTKQPPKNEH